MRASLRGDLECEKEENETDRREREKRPKLREKKKTTKNPKLRGRWTFLGRRAHQRERTDFLKKKKKTKKKTKKETKKNLCVIMEEPEEDAPDVPPVDDENVALQRSGLHNVSNTCYLNATVQVKHSSKREL